jgi:hypothetical protein
MIGSIPYQWRQGPLHFDFTGNFGFNRLSELFGRALRGLLKGNTIGKAPARLIPGAYGPERLDPQKIFHSVENQQRMSTNGG